MDCEQKLQNLKRRLAEKDSILVSFSGGVDSGLLAVLARDALGAKAFCVILDSEIMPRSELDHAKELAQSLGINCQIEEYSVLDYLDFIKNPPLRCYHCRKETARRLKNIALIKGISCIADGVNVSDCSEFRPGIAASDEEGIWHPFVDSRISKEEIREIARRMELSFWSRPASPCLATRVPYGDQISGELLHRVENAEDYLKSLGLWEVRVRVHGKVARIEVEEVDMGRVLHFRSRIGSKLKEIGFQYIALDLQGFRSGSLNEVL